MYIDLARAKSEALVDVYSLLNAAMFICQIYNTRRHASYPLTAHKTVFSHLKAIFFLCPQ